MTRLANRLLPDIIQEAIDKNISVLLTGNGYKIFGFLKIEHLDLFTDAKTGELFYMDKKEKKSIASFDDLVLVNFLFWKGLAEKAKDKEFVSPPKDWIEEYIRMGLAEKQIIYIPKK